MLFGIPLLKSIHASHDIHNSILYTKNGPIPLLSSFRPPKSPQSYATTAAANSWDIDLSNSNLTPEQQQQVKALLSEYDSLWRGDRRGEAADVAHRIRLLHDRPIVSRPRPITEEQQKIVKAEVDKMLKDHVIRPSNSPYASEVVLILKKTGDWRFCIDFRALNKVTILDKYPLPRISDLVRAIRGSKYFVALDLRAGYWQIPMEHRSIKYTAFRCFLGLFEFMVMPFGLTNAPATFQRLMDFLFNDLRFSGVLCYLDDILMHSRSFNHCLELLRTVLERLRAAGLTVNLKKSEFFPRTLKYLGQIIVDGRLVPDPKKVEAIRRIKTPASVHDVRSLLGFFGFYHTFIPRFAHIMTPVFDLLRNQKNSKHRNATTTVSWTADHQRAVDESIALLEKSVLDMPLEGDEFLVETDASGFAIGAVLSVKREDVWLPVEFYSKTLSKTERNWPTREREAYAIVAALQKFDCYVRGRRTVVHTDHQSLKWMLECQKGKIARWASLLAEYNLDIYYKKGTELVHIDFLTRALDAEPDATVADRMCYFATTEPIPPLDEILKAQRRDAIPATKGFVIKNEVIYYHGLLYVPANYRVKVIAACHSMAPFHHPGVKKTKQTIMRTFNWPNLHADVVRYLHSCLFCRRSRSGEERLQGLQRTHPMPLAFDTVYMDFWECTYGDAHFKVLTLIDQATKWAECTLMTDSTAKSVSTALLRSWIYRFGTPRVLVSDRDPAFCNTVFDRLSAQLGIMRTKSTPYHPEGNAVIESFHRTLNLGLRALDARAIPFVEALDLVLFAYRSTIHATTGHSPAFMSHGIDPRLPADNDWRMERSLPNKERLKFLATLRLDVQLQAQEMLKRQTMKRNEHRNPIEFEEGQLVLCRAVALDQARYKAAFYKATPKWTLPFRVTKVSPSKKSALVRCLLTQRTREVHIQDVKFISTPQGETQRREWFDSAEKEVKSMYDPATCRDIIEKFFEILDFPQLASSTPPPPRKRKRDV